MYELTVVLDGKTTPAKKKAFSDKLEALLSEIKGKVISTSDWGKKELGFPIKKSGSGYFLFFKIELAVDSLKKLTEKLRVDDVILRYLIVKESK